MSIAEMLGAEDNPFGLFLILILLLGATGYFDPKEKTASAEVAPEVETRPVIALPVWRTRPKEASLVRPFSGPRTDAARPKDSPAGRKDLLPAILEMLGLARHRSPAHGLAKFLRPQASKHALLRLRHKMQQ